MAESFVEIADADGEVNDYRLEGGPAGDLRFSGVLRRVDTGKAYLVRQDRRGSWHCGCPSYTYCRESPRRCKHVEKLEVVMSTGTAVEKREPASHLAEKAILHGDLSKLTADERMAYYREVCASLGLNPLTRPFEYISLNGKLVLYARRDCADQLRKLHGVSIVETHRELTEGVYVVTVHARTPDGRTDEEIGAVAIEGLKGEARANAMMKASTKAKRRATLSICGLGFLDETEVETIPDARPAPAEDDTGDAWEPDVAKLQAEMVRTGRTWEECARLVKREGAYPSDLTRPQYEHLLRCLERQPDLAARQAAAKQ